MNLLTRGSISQSRFFGELLEGPLNRAFPKPGGFPLSSNNQGESPIKDEKGQIGTDKPKSGNPPFETPPFSGP